MKRCLIFTSFFWITASATARDYYVAQDGQTPEYPYTNSWSAAASNIQDAVELAASGDRVLIRPGHYTASPAVEDSVVYIDGKTVSLIGMDGPRENIVIDGEGQYRGITQYVTSNVKPTVFENLTVRNCYFAGEGASGGGIYLLHDAAWSFQMLNCLIESNTIASTVATAASTGGGLYLSHVTSARDVDFLMSNCTLRANVATNLLFDKNWNQRDYVRSDAGGAYVASGINKVFYDTVFEDNWSGNYGGGLISYRGICTIINSIFRRNTAPYDKDAGSGGGGFTTSSSQVYMQNCLFEANHSNVGRPGSAIYLSQQGRSGDYEFRNCTIVKNTGTYAVFVRAWGSGQGYFPDLKFWNTIFYGNTVGDVLGGSTNDPPIKVFTNCYFASTNSFKFNFNHSGLVIAPSPLFTDFDGGDYSLGSGSPCINSGLNEDWMKGAYDLAGNKRINWGRVDMGAYEFQMAGSALLLR